MTQYHSTLCGCIYDVDAAYDYVSQRVEIEGVVTSHICDKHLPEKSRSKDNRILELLEQNRQLKSKCKRLDEYDDLVDENAQLLDALEDLVSLVDLIAAYAEDMPAEVLTTALATGLQIEKALAAAKGVDND